MYVLDEHTSPADPEEQTHTTHGKSFQLIRSEFLPAAIKGFQTRRGLFRVMGHTLLSLKGFRFWEFMFLQRLPKTAQILNVNVVEFALELFC